MPKSNLLTALSRLSDRAEIRAVLVNEIAQEMRSGKYALTFVGVSEAGSTRYQYLPYPAKRLLDDLSVQALQKLSDEIISILQGKKQNA